MDDAHGHKAGDEVLVAAAGVLRRESRAGDEVARVGGGKFAWLMPEADALDAWQAAERARAAVAAADMPMAGRITVSAGVCEPSRAGGAADLYRLADGPSPGRSTTAATSSSTTRPTSCARCRPRSRRAACVVRGSAGNPDARPGGRREGLVHLAPLRAGGAPGGPARRAPGLGPPGIERLHEAGLVHDVGKLAISGAVLLQAGPLTEEEYAGLKAHAAIGAEIVSEVFAEDQVAWVRHHERWNGHGYPDGLGAGELSDGAAILAIADAWDAMTSARPYRIAGSPAEALAECRRERGAQFRPVGGRCARRPGPTGRARAGSGRGTARRPGLIAAGGCARRGRGG